MKLAEDLKKAVLQAAMQGKLTKQLKTDSSVDELLKKIAEEKATLIEEGKIRKDTTKAGASGRALAEITEDEIPFDIFLPILADDEFEFLEEEEMPEYIF